jgi:hypothetical protein
MELRYLGFDQLRSARAFRFEIIEKGASNRQAVVTADMALFLQFHVGIQDGPTLCAGKLTADLEKSVDGEHVLTADDLRAYSESRAAAEAKRLEARAAAGRRHHATPSAFENPRGRV